MKNRLLAYLILIIAFSMQSFAQIEVTTQYRGRDVIFDANSKKYGTYTLVLEFTELRGYKSSIGNPKSIIKHGSNSSIYRLTYEGNSSTYYYRYSYTYYRGKYNSKTDINYPYLLPAATGKSLGIAQFENIKHNFGKNNTDSILGIVFNYRKIDTICAIRSGQVVEIKYSTKQRNNSEQGFVYYDKLSQNIITIEHADGSIARYVCISAVSVLPKEGDRIIAGQPIAIFTNEEEQNRMGLHLFYLDKNLKNQVIKPKFYTEEGLIQPEFGKRYKSISTREIIEKELTKKEKKNLNP
ncbi:M23 family metallopeptidase [Dysgonomonas sp.]